LRFQGYSYRHAKIILAQEHPKELDEIRHVLETLRNFSHGSLRQITPANYIAQEFAKNGWKREQAIELSSSKRDTVDLFKNRIAIEQEYSRFETLFRDFFRLMLLYDERMIDAGVIITYSSGALASWELRYKNSNVVKPYRAARATLDRLIDFLEGKYKTIIRIPLYCIGIE